MYHRVNHHVGVFFYKYRDGQQQSDMSFHLISGEAWSCRLIYQKSRGEMQKHVRDVGCTSDDVKDNPD
jgi:hypothetical protein